MSPAFKPLRTWAGSEPPWGPSTSPTGLGLGQRAGWGLGLHGCQRREVMGPGEDKEQGSEFRAREPRGGGPGPRTRVTVPRGTSGQISLGCHFGASPRSPILSGLKLALRVLTKVKPSRLLRFYTFSGHRQATLASSPQKTGTGLRGPPSPVQHPLQAPEASAETERAGGTQSPQGRPVGVARQTRQSQSPLLASRTVPGVVWGPQVARGMARASRGRRVWARAGPSRVTARDT